VVADIVAPVWDEPELVIFDCDGVLVDSETISNRVLAEMLTAEGLPTTLAQSRRDYQGMLLADIRSQAEEKLGHALSDDWLASYESERDAAFQRALAPVTGAVQAVQRIAAAGLRVCVASQGKLSKIALSLSLTGLDSSFRRPRASPATRSPTASRRPTSSCTRPRRWCRPRPLRRGRGHTIRVLPPPSLRGCAWRVMRPIVTSGRCATRAQRRSCTRSIGYCDYLTSTDARAKRCPSMIARRPTTGEHRVDGLVCVAVADPLGLACDALLGEPETLRDRTAAGVIDGRTDLHPMKPPRSQRVINEPPYSACHDASPLRGCGQPVADAGRTVLPEHTVEAHHTDNPAILDDRGLEPVVARQLLASAPDEGRRVNERLPRRPRHPPRQMLAVGLDDRIQLPRIRLLEQAQPQSVGHLDTACVPAGRPPGRGHGTAPPGPGWSCWIGRRRAWP